MENDDNDDTISFELLADANQRVMKRIQAMTRGAANADDVARQFLELKADNKNSGRARSRNAARRQS